MLLKLFTCCFAVLGHIALNKIDYVQGSLLKILLCCKPHITNNQRTYHPLFFFLMPFSLPYVSLKRNICNMHQTKMKRMRKMFFRIKPCDGTLPSVVLCTLCYCATRAAQSKCCCIANCYCTYLYLSLLFFARLVSCQ